jgi:sugar lactone lactonase YvrE
MRRCWLIVVLLAGCDRGPTQEVGFDLLFFSRLVGEPTEVHGMRLDVPDERGTLDVFAGATALSFLDAERVVATIGGKIVVATGSGGAAEPITPDIVVVGPDGVDDTVICAGFIDPGPPEFNEDGDPISVPIDFDLYRIDLATGGSTQLTEGPAFDSAVTVANDGRVFYVSNASGQNELWALEESGPRQVTTGAGLVGRASVTRDGATLVWGQARPGGPVLVQADTTDGVIRPLGRGVVGSSPAIARDGRVVFSRFATFDEDQDPVAELFVYDPASDTVKQLTDDGRIAFSPALAR